MAKIAPSFAPYAVLPKFDFDALVRLQRANLDTMIEAQKIFAEAGQAMLKLQLGWMKEAVQQAQVFYTSASAKKPETVFADAQAVAGRAIDVAKQGFQLGSHAQTQVADLFAKRAAANFNEVKQLAA